MAKKFLSAIQLLTVNADPASASAGDLYFNTTSNLVKYHDGTSWVAVPKNLSNLQDVNFSSVEDGNTISYDSATGKWTNVVPASGLVGYGPSYPLSGTNGQLFYNTLTLHLAVYYDGIWRETANQEDVTVLDGGASGTTEFAGVVDGGDSFTSSFDRVYDGGNVNQDITFSGVDGGTASTLTFYGIYDGGNSSTSIFSDGFIDGGGYSGGNDAPPIVIIDSGYSSDTVVNTFSGGESSTTDVEFVVTFDGGNS